MSHMGPVVTPTRPDPVGESEPKSGDARLILLFYILLSFLFRKCRDLNPRLDLKGGSEPELGLL